MEDACGAAEYRENFVKKILEPLTVDTRLSFLVTSDLHFINALDLSAKKACFSYRGF